MSLSDCPACWNNSCSCGGASDAAAPAQGVTGMASLVQRLQGAPARRMAGLAQGAASSRASAAEGQWMGGDAADTSAEEKLRFKDCNIRQLVNDLCEIATRFHATPRLRARVSDAIEQFLVTTPGQGAARPPFAAGAQVVQAESTALSMLTPYSEAGVARFAPSGALYYEASDVQTLLGKLRTAEGDAVKLLRRARDSGINFPYNTPLLAEIDEFFSATATKTNEGESP